MPRKRRLPKKIEYVHVDWNNLKSIQNAERKKLRLENAGYGLMRQSTNLFVYMRPDKKVTDIRKTREVM
jgi:hypothetical protein